MANLQQPLYIPCVHKRRLFATHHRHDNATRELCHECSAAVRSRLRAADELIMSDIRVTVSDMQMSIYVQTQLIRDGCPSV